MTEIFKIPYPKSQAERKKWSKRFGLNAYWSGKHWAQRKQDADYWHWLVRSEMEKQKVRQKLFDKPVVVSFYWNDRLDIDNHSVMGKLIVDAIKGRVIVDDRRQYLRGVEHYFHEADYILVKIREA